MESLLLGLHVAFLELREGHLLLDELHHDLLLFADASPLLLELTLGVRHYLICSHSSLPDQVSAGTCLNLFQRLGLFLLRNQFIVRIILQVVFARLLDDIECGKDVKSVIYAALDILVLDRLLRSSL